MQNTIYQQRTEEAKLDPDSKDFTETLLAYTASLRIDPIALKATRFLIAWPEFSW